ncbi:MAG: carboxypeptidase-like regulatory domain-containing protein, partial [Planctomycetota bacterium]
LLVVAGAGAWAAGWFASAPAVAPPGVPPLASAEPTRTEHGGSVGDAVTAGDIASLARVAAGASGGELQVVVVVAEQDKVVAAAACSIWTRNAGQRAQLVGEARTGDDGSVAFAALAPGPYLFVVDAPEHREELAIEAGAVTRLRCEIDAGVRCSGIVVDRDGRPVAGAAVHRACDWFSVVVARSAADGSFALDHLRRGSGQVWAVQPGRQPSRRHDLDGKADTSDVRLVLGEFGTRLGGRVVDEQGRPAAKARVYVGFELPTGSTTFRQYERHDVRTDAAGTFAIDWARPGHTVVAAVPADHDLERASFRELDLVAGEPAAVQLQLGDGASVAGVVRGEQGQPLAAIDVQSSDNDHGLAPLDRRFGVSGVDGSFALRGLIPGKQWLSAQRAGGKGMRVDTNVELRAGQRADWNPVLGEGAPIAVHVVDPDGEPVARRHLSVAVGGEISAYGHTDEAGRYRFVHMPPVEHQLRVYGAEYGVVLAERAVVPGAAEIEIRLDAAQVPSARLSGRIVDAAGRPVADAEVTLNANSGFVQSQHPDRDGRFRTELLPPGRYGISARARSQGLGHAFRGVTLVAKAEHDLGDLVLPATASLAVRLRGPDGAAVPDAMLRLGHRRETASGTDFLAPDEVDGVYRKAGIDPGPDYVLRLHAPGVVPQCLPLALAAGERRELDVVAERGVTVTLELRCALAHPQGRGNLNAQVDVFDGAGERVACVRLWPYFDDFDQRLERVRLGLRPGKYRVHAEEFGARKTEVAIEVPATAPGQPFVIDLR